MGIPGLAVTGTGTPTIQLSWSGSTNLYLDTIAFHCHFASPIPPSTMLTTYTSAAWFPHGSYYTGIPLSIVVDPSGAFATITILDTAGDYFDTKGAASNYLQVGGLHNAGNSVQPNCASVDLFTP